MVLLLSKCYQSRGETVIYSNNSDAKKKQSVARAILDVLTMCGGDIKMGGICFSTSWRVRDFVKVSLVNRHFLLYGFCAALVGSLAVIQQLNHVRRCNLGETRGHWRDSQREGSSLYSLGCLVCNKHN